MKLDHVSRQDAHRSEASDTALGDVIPTMMGGAAHVTRKPDTLSWLIVLLVSLYHTNISNKV
jgi:pantoate kinase